jgi:hypothetical protein
MGKSLSFSNQSETSGQIGLCLNLAACLPSREGTMSKRKRDDVIEFAHGNPKRSLGKAGRVVFANRNQVSDKENITIVPEPRSGKQLLLPKSKTFQHPSLKSLNETKARELRTPLIPKAPRNNVLQQHPISRHVIRSDFFSDQDWIEQQQGLFTSILNETFRQGLSHKQKQLSPFDSNEREIAFQYYQSDVFQVIKRRLTTVSHLARKLILFRHSEAEDYI